MSQHQMSSKKRSSSATGDSTLMVTAFERDTLIFTALYLKRSRFFDVDSFDSAGPASELQS